MNEILNKNISEIAGMSFDCGCGRNHAVNIKEIIIGRSVIGEVVKCASNFKGGKIFLVADNNTYRVCGNKIQKLMVDNNIEIETFIYNAPGQLIPDEKSVGRLLVEMDRGISLILAVGSGVLNDLGKFISSKTRIPYMIVSTAPSMDGYASIVSPIIVNGLKKTLEGTYPVAIIGDVDIMKEAPMEMLQAGFGDILGKLTALADWDLARIVKKELYCETCVSLVKNVLEKCMNNVAGLVARDEKAVEYVMEGLVLSGIAIGLHGDSRPASGAEHNFAHFWDMDAIGRGEEHPLHGNSVAVGTVITCCVYELMKPYLPEGFNLPNPQQVIGYLEKLGAVNNPCELGISRELFIKSMYKAFRLKPRYTIFNLAEEKGVLDDVTDKLTEKFYGYHKFH